MNAIQKYLTLDANDHPIHIVSGEGTGPGTVELYTGKRTERAIKMRLTKERCGGDRWARASIYTHTADYGIKYGVDLIDGMGVIFTTAD